MPEPEAAAVSAVAPLPAAVPELGDGPARRLGLLFWLSAGWLALIVLAAVLARWIPGLPSPTETGVGPARQAPTAQHLLGTDSLGRDMLARTIYGARVSLVVGFTSITAGLLVGGALGVLAGYYRGRFEAVVMGAMDVLLAFPALVLALALVSFLGPRLGTVSLAIAILSVAPIARVIRANTLTFAQREFVLAARTLGAKNRRIIVSELLPNVLPAALSFALVAVAVAIVAEGALAFLGLSVPAPQPTWGSMINEGRTLLQQAPHISFVPSGAMFLTVLALNFAGDSLRARFDAREGRL
ncbi:MAG TPA: ABC transporter permease [Acidimicrobiales bacterium]|jgi:peptide/nickel transport system permease protein|nr:ABC transporter permease [Acidimicrobiales bacterium]